MKKEAVFIVLALMCIPSLVLAADVVGDQISGDEDGDDGDNIPAEDDMCPDTPYLDILVYPGQDNAQYFLGCSCSQVVELLDQGFLPCYELQSCEEGLLDLTERAPGEIVHVNCQEDYCNAQEQYFDYPDDFELSCGPESELDPCEEGLLIEDESLFCAAGLGDEDDDGVVDIADNCPGSTGLGNLTPSYEFFEEGFVLSNFDNLAGCDCQQREAYFAEFYGMSIEENVCLSSRCWDAQFDLTVYTQSDMNGDLWPAGVTIECPLSYCEEGNLFSFSNSVNDVCTNGYSPECRPHIVEQSQLCTGDDDVDGVSNEEDVCPFTPAGSLLVSYSEEEEDLVKGCTCEQLLLRSEQGYYPCSEWICDEQTPTEGHFAQMSEGVVNIDCASMNNCYFGISVNFWQESEEFICPEQPVAFSPELVECTVSHSQLCVLGDADEDGITDGMDMCPNSEGNGDIAVSQPIGLFLADYGMTAIDLRGCDCEQIDAIIEDLLEIDDLDDYPCFPDLRCDGQFYMPVLPQGLLLEGFECENYCNGTSYYQHATPQEALCTDGQMINAPRCVNYDIEENSEFCQDNQTEAPLQDVALMYNLSEEIPMLSGELTIVEDELLIAMMTKQWQYQAEIGEVIEYEFLALLDFDYFAQTSFHAELKRQGNELELLEFDESYTAAGEHYYYKRWQLPSEEAIEEFFELKYYYLDSQSATQVDSNTYVVALSIEAETENLELELIEGDGLIGYAEGDAQELTEEEEDLLEEVVSEAIRTGAVSSVPMEIVREKVELATNNLDLVKERRVETRHEQRVTTFDLVLEPKREGDVLYNVTIFEEIPKEVAHSVSEIRFSVEPTRIIKDDPLIMWHFDEVGDRVDLSYEVDKEVEVTGNTIITAQEVVGESPIFHIIVPLILIPFIGFVFILLPRLSRREEK